MLGPMHPGTAVAGCLSRGIPILERAKQVHLVCLTALYRDFSTPMVLHRSFTRMVQKTGSAKDQRSSAVPSRTHDRAPLGRSWGDDRHLQGDGGEEGGGVAVGMRSGSIAKAKGPAHRSACKAPFFCFDNASRGLSRATCMI